MLRHALKILIVALAAGVAGYIGIAGTLMLVANILFFLAVVSFVVSLVYSRRRSYSRLLAGPHDGVSMENSLTPIFGLVEHDSLRLIPLRSVNVPVEARWALPSQQQKLSAPQALRVSDCFDHTNRLSP